LRAESGYGGYSAEVDTAATVFMAATDMAIVSLVWRSDQQSRRDFSAALQKAARPENKAAAAVQSTHKVQ
jgi:hypothetical protein